MKSPKKRTILILSAAAGVLAVAVLLAVVLPAVIKTEDGRQSGMEESAGSPDMVVDLFDETGEEVDAETNDKMRRMEQELKELREELRNARMKAAAESGDQEENDPPLDDDSLLDDDPNLEYFIEIPAARAARFRLAEDDLNENGIPDEWEKEFGISADFTDPDSDEDSDAFTLLQEYTAKTNPVDPLSHPKYITGVFVSAVAPVRIQGLELVSIDRTNSYKNDWQATFNVLRNNRKRSEFVRINGTFNNNNVEFSLVDIETDDKTQEPIAYLKRRGKQERIPCRPKQQVYDPMPRVRFVDAIEGRTITATVGSEFSLGTSRSGREQYRVLSADPDTKNVVVESADTRESFVLLPKPPDPPEEPVVDPASDEDSDGFSLERENEAGTDPADPLSHPKYIDQILVYNVARKRFQGLELVSVDRSKADKKDWVATFNVIVKNRLRQAFVQMENSSGSLTNTFRNINVDFRLVDIEMDETMREPIAVIQRVGREERIACRVRQPVYDPMPGVRLFNALYDQIIMTSVGSVFRLGTPKYGQEQYKVVSADLVTKSVVVEAVGDTRETINVPLKPLNEDPASDEDSDGFTLSQENKAGTDPREPLSHPKYISQIFVSDISRQTFPGLELLSADMPSSNKKDWSVTFNVVGGNGSRKVSVQIYNSSRASRSIFSNNNVDFRLVDIRIDEKTRDPVAVIQRVGREENITCRVNQPVYDPIARVSLFNAINGRILTLSVGSGFKLGTEGTGEEQYRVVSADQAAKKVVVESDGWMTGTFSLKPAPRSEGN